MELSREAQENENEKLFIIKGTADQIARVKQMIEEKVSNAPDMPHPRSPMPYSNQQSMFGVAQPYGGMPMGGMPAGGMPMGYGGEHFVAL